jgi:glutamine synthetase
VLKKVLAEAEESGYTIKVGPECEFFLFKLNEEGKPTNITQDEGGYFDMGPVDQGEDARRDIILALEEMGFEIMASHHEVAQGQHEVDLWFDGPLLTADRVTTFKFVTRAVASKNGLCATFMPKPIVGINGSGMHTHFSIYDHLGRNIFYDPRGKYQLSEVALHFIGGLIQHAPAITAISNPLVNSYKRLIPGYEAPKYISWSGMNRSALVRIPASRVEDTRVEFRSPDPSCNPYLAFAVMIKAGLEGIKNKIEPPVSVVGNFYYINLEERKAAGIRRLPANLMEALEELKKDELIRSVLGEHIYAHFTKAKRIEWELYQKEVHQWELDQYLGVF